MKSRHKHLCAIGLALAIAIMGGGYFLLNGSPTCETALAETSGLEAPVEATRVAVMLTPVTVRDFEERLVLQGNLEAKNFAMVPARVPGTLEEIFVDEGDAVVANETQLFQVDSVKLIKALEVRRQELAVAKCALKESQANRERVQADFDKATLDYERFQRLYKQKVVAEDALEQQESRFKQTRALQKHADTLVDLASEQETQAVAAVEIAEKDLSDSLVYAPLSGTVSLRFKEVGEMAEVGKPLIRIEDPSVIEVSVFLPAQYYPRVIEGKTALRVNVYGIDCGEQVVSYKSPAIHPKLRTFEVKCVLTSPPAGVVPGAMAEVQVLLDRQKEAGVPRTAVQLRNDREVVFVVENDIAKMVEVETGMETDGWVSVKGDKLAAGTPVITEGQYFVQDGAPVSVRGDSATKTEGEGA